jgi:hypothetical protein
MDNLTYIPAWMSDALCRLSTGGGFSTRLLYTDEEEKIFELTRPAILNGIGDVVIKGDLLDRSIVLRLPCLTDGRKAEDSFWHDFEAVRAGILGCIFEGISAAMRGAATEQLSETPRLADFAKWVAAAEKSFGWDGRFLSAYQTNRKAASVIPLDINPIASMLMREGFSFEGTATALLNRLTEEARLEAPPVQGLPRAPNTLKAKLRELQPNLASVGVDVDFERVGSQGTKVIRIKQRRSIVSIDQTDSTE